MKKFFGNDFISVADANGIEVYDTTASTWRGVLVRYYYNIECNVYYSYRDGVNIKTRKLSKAEIKTEIRLIIERGERVGSTDVTEFAFKLVGLKTLLAEKKRPKNYQTGSTNKALDKKRKAKAPGKRISATGRTYTERRKNRSDARPKYRL